MSLPLPTSPPPHATRAHSISSSLKTITFLVVAVAIVCLVAWRTRASHRQARPAPALATVAQAKPADSTGESSAASSALPASLFPALGQKQSQPKQFVVDVNSVRAKYPNLLGVKYFSTVDVVILGSKGKLGLKDGELNEFAMSCYGQLFRGYDLKPIPADVSTVKSGEFGTLNVVVETYPLGLAIELRMGSVGSDQTWTTNEFRVSSNQQVKDGRLLKTSIANMLAKAAVTLRKSQGL